MNIEFKAIGGATWVLQIDNLKIACDPVLAPKGVVHDYKWFKSTRIEEPVYRDDDFKDIDIWLLTHNHEDHIDDIGISKIEKSSKIIVHKNLLSKFSNYDVDVIKHGDKLSFKIKEYEIYLVAIPAIHGVNPVSAFFAGGVNGYWLSIKKNDEEICIYISSDTVYKNKVVNALKNYKVDIFIPNMGGASKGTWLGALTMTAKMLDKFIDKLNPSLTLPVHFGTFSHYNEPISETEKLNNDSIVILNAGENYKTSLIRINK